MPISDPPIINTSIFKEISLEEAERAQLMQRIDYKYVLQLDMAKKLLSGLAPSYYAVNNNGHTLPKYISEYYDTPNLKMYMDHQNRRPRRYKIRVRHYCASGDSFLEIKIKAPSGKTIKKRIAATSSSLNQPHIANFVLSKSPYNINELTKTLETQFNRLTLVGTDYTERITFDFNLSLTLLHPHKTAQLNDICIVEVKRERGKLGSPIFNALKEMKVKPIKFSKYSIGCALLQPGIKYNNFKETMLYLNKIHNDSTRTNNAIG